MPERELLAQLAACEPTTVAQEDGTQWKGYIVPAALWGALTQALGEGGEPELLTIKAASRRFSVSYDLIHTAILCCDLPALRPSRQWLVAPSDVRALLERRTDEARGR